MREDTKKKQHYETLAHFKRGLTANRLKNTPGRSGAKAIAHPCAKGYRRASPVILQKLLQLLAREEDAAFHCAKRQGEPFGNLTVFETRQVHEEGDAILARQAVHNLVYLLAVVVVFGYIAVEILRAVYVEKIVGVVNECLVAHHLAVVVYEYIAHYGIYPSLEIGVGSVFVHVAQSL